ncbi:MAG TPA: radical SAM protein [Candidatus Acidoferrales bacterium]|nr:radical SAM protein [Candidatus Acidoferrales bacterium]
MGKKDTLRGRWHATRRTTHELWLIGKALVSTRHVVQAHIIPIRRCNLDCAYCNEYDEVSAPVPLEEMHRRIDKLAELGTSLITISGGEPLLHPELDDIIRRIKHHGRVAGLITNGYLLVPERIERLNRAGLDHLQISIDNLKPDDVSKKSLKVLDQKLEQLAEFADFHVNINSVLGSGVNNPEDALVIAGRARSLGFTSTVGIIHDGSGQLRALGPVERNVFERIMDMSKGSYSRFNRFQRNLAEGKPNDWRCRAGSRYLYICEDGLVHYCSQQRGWPGVPLARYTLEDVHREFYSRKPCAAHCTVSCVQQTSYIDHWRAPQHLDALPSPRHALDREAAESLVQIETESGD